MWSPGALIVFLSGLFALGFALDHELLTRAGSRATRVERLVSALLLSVVLWLVIAWALALGGWLSRTTLLAVAVIAWIVAVALRARRRREPAEERGPRSWIAIAVLLPVIGWTLFLLWRGVVAPPLAPDALTYHLPRAALIAKSGEFTYFTEIRDSRANQYPANYELLVATMLSLDGSDRFTEWLSTFFFVLFLLQTAALCRQWWGRGPHVVAAVLVAASMPVLLLQGATHKNDVMISAFFLGALLALGRWLEEFDWHAALVLGVCTAAAIGTKSHGIVFAAIAFVPFAWGALRHMRRGAFRARAFLIVTAVVLALIPLLGAWAYLVAQQSPGMAQANVVERVTPVVYGEWSYLAVAPALLLLRPISGDATVRLPWNGEEWLWDRYDPYASHFGFAVSVLALAFPFAWLRLRKAQGELAPFARHLVTLVAVALFLVALPVKAHIYGYISGYPRYLLFITPFVFAWVVSPLVREIVRQRGERTAWLILALFAVLTAQTMRDVARNDKFATLRDLCWAAAHPGTRWMPSMPWRAASVVDDRAAEDARVDVHGGDDTWIYPAYGESLRRDVHFIDDVNGIRPEAEWVIVDRAFSVIWLHPEFRHMRDWKKYLDRGTPGQGDLKVIRQLDADPRFKRVYADERLAQAVYRRVRNPA